MKTHPAKWGSGCSSWGALSLLPELPHYLLNDGVVHMPPSSANFFLPWTFWLIFFRGCREYAPIIRKILENWKFAVQIEIFQKNTFLSCFFRSSIFLLKVLESFRRGFPISWRWCSACFSRSINIAPLIIFENVYVIERCLLIRGDEQHIVRK